MKLRFLLGAGIGYVLGTRAGREQYERISASVRDLADTDLARNLRSQVSEMTGGGASSQPATPSTPPLTAGPGSTGGTDAQTGPGTDVVLPDLEPSTSSNAPSEQPQAQGGRPPKRTD